LLPSFLRGRDFASLFLLTVVHWAFAVMMPMAAVSMLFAERNADAGFVVFALVYPLLFGVWLARMVMQSVAYAANGVIPTWSTIAD